MATRSRIGIQLKDDSVLSAYHHWDGYPEWLGKTLVEHFNSKEKASELIDGGDMSVCWTKDRWDSEPNQYGGATKSEGEEYGPQYYSQRGEDTPPRLDADLVEYLLPDNSEEFSYIFTSAGWVCYDMHQFDDSKLPEVVEIPA